MKDLKDTIGDMMSENYRQRFKAEYWQTKIRYEKLKNLVHRIELEEEDGCEDMIAPKHNSPLSLIKDQQYHMGEYLGILEKRAIVEMICLGEGYELSWEF